MDGKSLSDHALEYGSKTGADYVEVRYISSTDENYIARNGSFISIQKKPSEGIGIRVLIDGCMGFGSVDSMNKRSVERLVNSIVNTTKLSSRENPIKLSEERSVNTCWKVPVKIPFVDISSKEKQNHIKELDSAIKKCTGKAVKNRIIFMNMHTSEKYIVTSHGSKVDSDFSSISVYNILNASVKGKNEQRMLGLGGTSGWEWLKEENISSLILREAKNLTNTVKKAKKIDLNKPVDVVVGGEVSGIMAHENVGHPSESDRIMGREGAQAGESFYKDILDGESISDVKMGNEMVSVMDDPTLKGSPGFYRYDDECIKARPRYLVKNGKLNELLLNREFAHVFDTRSNASARSNSYSREPIPRMSNTFFKPGEYTVEELIEGVKHGILMKSFTEWNIDDRRFHSKYVGLEAYLIKNGEVTDTMVKRPVLELTTMGILGNIDAVSKEYESRMAHCGKSDPMQPVSVSVGGPHLRMRDIKVG